MQKAIAYYRVSTARQGRKGLSLDAQQKSVYEFAKKNGYRLIDEFEEIRSSRLARHALIAALAECKATGAVLLIAKLDRLSRNVAFVSTLMESKVRFKVVDNPFADRFTLHILSAVGEKELEDIRTRIISALAIARLRGTELGKYGRYVLSKLNRRQADRFARRMKPIITRLKKRGIVSLRRIADELNRLHVPTFRKKDYKWHPNTVFNLLKRLAKLNH